jgi:hypothetical protein
MPGIVTNSETGEVRAVIDPSAPAPVEPTPTAPTPDAPGTLTAPAPGSPAAARAEFTRLRQDILDDLHHPFNDPTHPLHEAAQRDYLRLGMLADGKDFDDPEDNKVIGEVFEGGRMRPPGADALSPGPRPALPEGFEFDEGALVLGEIQAHAMGARPSLVMEITDALAGVAEQAEARGVGWAPQDAEAELGRRFGSDGAARVIDNAKVAYQTLLESDQPLLVQRVRELGEGWGDDPGVIALFGTLVYEALREGPMTPAKEALLLRRAEREMQARP